MPKSEAFALATMQGHALGKSPKGYGTAEGRSTAKAKYDTPKDDKKTANPGGLESTKFAACADELAKLSFSPGGAISRVGGALANPSVREHGTELAGLGILAAPGLDTLQAHARARLAGDKGPGAVEKRQLMGEAGHAAADVGGLGVLMGPEIAKLMKHGGVLDTLKRVALTDIPGTKPWVLGNVEKATANAAKGTLRPSAVSGVRRMGAGGAVGNGVYDVSQMAQKMGIR
jgi:hypothetical protein